MWRQNLQDKDFLRLIWRQQMECSATSSIVNSKSAFDSKRLHQAPLEKGGAHEDQEQRKGRRDRRDWRGLISVQLREAFPAEHI